MPEREDLTGTTTPVYEPPFMNRIIDHETWLQYMQPQGDRFISVTRRHSDGAITIACYSRDGTREWGATPIIETGGNHLVITVKQEDK